MKKYLILMLACAATIVAHHTVSAQNKNLGVGTTTPNPNAVLDIVSPTNNQGVLFPRLTTAQRTTLAGLLDADDSGLMLYDTDEKALYIWDGAAWKNNDATTLHLPLTGTANSNALSLEITETNAANMVGVVAISTAGEGAAIKGDNSNANGAITTAHGVMGVANAGGNNAGVYGTTVGGGTGVMAETTTGWSALFAYQHNPTFGWGADVEIDAPSNNWASLFAHTQGLGPAGSFASGNDSTTIYAKNSGTGSAGYFVRDNTDGTNPALYVKSNGGFTNNSAAIIAESDGGYAGVVSKQKSGLGNALVAISESPEAGSWGLLAESANGSAGVFQSTASAEPVLQLMANGNGGGGTLSNNGTGSGFTITNGPASLGIGLTVFQNGVARAAQFQVNNTSSTNAAVRGAHLGLGNAGFFTINNASNTNAAVLANTNGFGPALAATYTGGATGGSAVFAEHDSPADGFAGQFINSNGANTFPAIQASTVGSAPGVRVFQDGSAIGGGMDVFSMNPSNTQPGFSAEMYGSGAAIRGIAKGSGHAGNFQIDNPLSTFPALEATTNGTSPAIAGYTASGWSTMQLTQAGTGSGLHVENQSTGTAAFITLTNSVNTSPTLTVHTNGTGNALYANHTGASGNVAVFANNGSNVARVDKLGTGYFNNGTLNSGADIAEMFAVEGGKQSYEPGDVLVISESSDRTVERSSSASSTRVAGVYASKPGVRLTEESIDADLDELVPMGVVGVIPTKVCLENGAIKRGDLLVTSSKAGHAMKAIPVNVNGVLIYPTGAILGKALENFDGQESGLIKVLVNVK